MPSSSFNLVTINIHGLPFPFSVHKRVKELARQLEAGDVSIVTVQELHTHDLLQQLKRGLPSFPYVNFASGLIGPRAGLATFSKVPISETHFQHFSFRKGVLISRLENGSYLMNTHLIPNRSGDWSDSNSYFHTQLTQVNQLLAAIEVYESRASSIVLAGDFNIAKTSSLYEELTIRGNLKDAFGADMHPTFRQEQLPTGRIAQCIDFILGRRNIEFSNAHQIFVDPITQSGSKKLHLSDHVGLYATVIDHAGHE